MSDKQRGLYGKYHVERTDGKPIDGPTFTLELWRDPLARYAYHAYIVAADDAGYHELAKDMRATLAEAEAQQDARQEARDGE